MYTVVGADGLEYGPVSRETLQGWVAQGRVTPTTVIKAVEAPDGLPADHIPSLQTLFRAPPMYVPAIPVAIPGAIQVPAGTHSVGTAVLLALLITGLGQIYNKQGMKGLIILLVSVVLAVFTCGFSIILTHPFAIIDAVLIAQRLNRGEAIRDWQCF
jgi:TM2 domain-containing membrane protein YozV